MNTLLLKYWRIPKTFLYDAVFKYGTTDETLKESSFPTTLTELKSVPLEEAIEVLHTLLNEYPHEHVCIMQTPYQENSDRLLRMHVLSPSLSALIRNDVEKAKRAFAPVI